ncbi:MAG TPA: agmatine deiminase family protein [Ignavibacteria bacterium]|nr:agmatine deiminase family protein [Ignavibacteria bacterium]HMR40343.1 agmatine deiminase family protein [Ignavibacteria bacterium]
MNIFIVLLLSLILTGNSFSQDLPHYMSDAEKDLYKNYTPPGSNLDDTNPPPTEVRTMAEWEQVQGIIVAWNQFTPIVRQIVDYAQEEGLVYIVCSDSNTVKSYLTSGNVPIVNLKFLLAPLNSVWCRDYGPWAVYSGISDSLKLIDWTYNRPRPLDDQMSVAFANSINTPLYQTIAPPNQLIATGGNFMVDGNGTGFSSRLIVNENPTLSLSQIEGILDSYMGIKRYVKMDLLPYDVIHHIDMHMKLLDEETILVGEYPPGVADGPQIEANIQHILNNYLTCYGRPYKIVRIPMPPSASGQYPPSSDYYTYTNSVFINRTVIVPVYGLSLDSTAIRIYRENLPGYNIVSINASSMIASLGAIHCITKEIGVNEPIFFSHPKLLNTVNTLSPYEVKSYIKTTSGVSSAKVYWRTDTTQSYNSVNMTMTLDTFTANIPPQPLGTNVYYYISATSNSGKTNTKPITAPEGYIKFTIENPTSVNQNLMAAESFYLNQNYPNPFNPETIINYNIGSKSLVSIKMFDVNGKEIRQVVNEIRNAGSYDIKFNGLNLPSGIYFYTMTADGFLVDTKRMILLK